MHRSIRFDGVDIPLMSIHSISVSDDEGIYQVGIEYHLDGDWLFRAKTYRDERSRDRAYERILKRVTAARGQGFGSGDNIMRLAELARLSPEIGYTRH